MGLPSRIANQKYGTRTSAVAQVDNEEKPPSWFGNPRLRPPELIAQHFAGLHKAQPLQNSNIFVALFGLRQAAARQSCRHCREQAPGRDPGLDQGTARPPAPLQPSSRWTATIESEAGLLKNRALRMAEAAKSKSQAPRRGRRRSDRVVSAAPAHAPSEAAE